VIAQAVGLYDEAEIRPVEIDSEPADVLLRQGLRKAGPSRDRQESPLELGVSEHELASFEDLAKRAYSSLPPPILDGRPERLGIHQVQLVSLVDRRLERE
jgi:hypothetical protein